MEFARLRNLFGQSENAIKGQDLSLLGLTVLTCYFLYRQDSQRKSERQKQKRFRYLYTADECQQLQIDSKQITVQGQINSDDKFLLLKSSNYMKKRNNYEQSQQINKSFMIVDPYTKAGIICKIKNGCLFEQTLFNFHKKHTYQTYVPSNCNFIVRLYKRIVNYFFGKTIVEDIEGVDLNQYFIFKGELKKKDSELMLEVDHVAFNSKFNIQESTKVNNLSILKQKYKHLCNQRGFLIYNSYQRMKKYFQNPLRQPIKLFEKREDEVAEDSDLCIACMESVRNVLILPCFHLICCQECLQKIKQTNNECPLCRTLINDQKQVLIDNLY
ncbi:unnamed protein product (macronuclear) [Paramecium tetraurelia]|uniref:RING-type domain-containing protein n=1 Tax=Paramecium tetraurelia TaxID=5888 RepID=A0DDR1_PARTE|nr:uncharacterized protein GSPATT00016019001 [Paramecium tetraurelia]CAK81178.1 unnamed protein product [Paramecium tetraurelia]|eukprot:XP_001448575.1 hypothetical protein (macronuclear) [Paramecium tetraurelia strain d4-2]